MLDIARMERIRLSPRPRFQRFIGAFLLAPNYAALPGVSIRFEGLERVPSEPVFFAMNHTDRFNYWPFQFRLWRMADRFTATWVKGKYYEHPLLALFMEKVNSIPTVSRGYLVTRDFLSTLGRRPAEEEYDALRGWVDGETGAAESSVIPEAIRRRARSVLGRPFDPGREDYASAVRAVYRRMMDRFVELHREAFASGLDVLVFPQGTRSRRLSRGHIGLAQMAWTCGRPIVPVGCNGCDQVYRGSLPIARGGRIVYRFGPPIRLEDASRFRPEGAFTPFDPASEEAHRERFQGLVDLVTDRINDLVDPLYRYSDRMESLGVEGSRRFV